MSEVSTVTNSLVSAPLPDIVQKLGLSIAQAQLALDQNSVEIAKALAETEVDIGDETYNLLSLGFVPSFYAFTEATVEAKLSFSINEAKETSINASLSGGVNTGVYMVAASVSVGYARKFSVSSEGTSSLAARLISLPPPDTFTQILRRQFQTEIPGS